MAIAQLYNPQGVVVGQAAVFIAPANTALPVYSAATINIADPFDPTPWVQTKLAAQTSAITAGTYVLTYTLNGTPYAVASQTAVTGTAANLKAAIIAALAAVPGGAPATTEVIVTGGPVSALATPFSIVLADRLLGGVWTMTPTGITGGTLLLTNGIWSPVGGTDAGWTYGTNKSTQMLYIEEQSTPVAQTITNQQVQVQGALAEDISRTLALAWNATNAVTAPGVGQSGFTRTTLTDSILTYALAMVTPNALGFARYMYAPIFTQLSNSQTAFRRAQKNRIYPVTFSTICATTAITADDFFAAGT